MLASRTQLWPAHFRLTLGRHGLRNTRTPDPARRLIFPQTRFEVANKRHQEAEEKKRNKVSKGNCRDSECVHSCLLLSLTRCAVRLERRILHLFLFSPSFARQSLRSTTDTCKPQ